MANVTTESNVIEAITCEEELNEAIKVSSFKVVVIDVHKKWSGSCEAMWPTFETIRQNTPVHEKRFATYSIEIDSLSHLIQAIVPAEVKNIKSKGCSPLFLVFRDQICKAVVNGCNSPQLITEIENLMPPKPVDEN